MLELHKTDIIPPTTTSVGVPGVEETGLIGDLGNLDGTIKEISKIVENIKDILDMVGMNKKEKTVDMQESTGHFSEYTPAPPPAITTDPTKVIDVTQQLEEPDSMPLDQVAGYLDTLIGAVGENTSLKDLKTMVDLAPENTKIPLGDKSD